MVDARRRHAALVRADGAVRFGQMVGSIHRAGALAQGLEACNGWTFWHVETKAGLMPIDAPTLVAVGDLSQIEQPIRALNLGTVEVWDREGNKLR